MSTTNTTTTIATTTTTTTTTIILLHTSHLYTRIYLSFPEPQVTERISLLFVENFTSNPFLLPFRISYSYTPIEGVRGCIYDVQCLSDEEVAVLGEPKELNETSFAGNFSFGDIVTYRCPVAKKFALENGSMVPEVEYKCQWNGTWSGSPSAHPECTCK